MIVELRLGTGATGVGDAAAGPEVYVDDLDRQPDGSLRCFLRALECDADRIVTAIGGRETVEGVRLIDSCDDGYRLLATVERESSLTRLYGAVLAADGMFLGGDCRGEGIHVRLWLPDRDRFDQIRASVAEFDSAVTVASVSSGEPSADDGPYGLSDPQREILLVAHARGYFRVPRESTLGELAAELDVSTQAASERLRRGLNSLVAATLAGRPMERPTGSFRA